MVAKFTPVKESVESRDISVYVEVYVSRSIEIKSSGLLFIM